MDRAHNRSGLWVLGVLSAGILLCGCASGRDSWTGQDKLLHLGVAAAISGGVTYAGMQGGDDRSDASFKGIGVVLLLGAGKEARDHCEDGNFWSWKDMAWNVGGALLGAGLAQALTDPD